MKRGKKKNWILSKKQFQNKRLELLLGSGALESTNGFGKTKSEFVTSSIVASLASMSPS